MLNMGKYRWKLINALLSVLPLLLIAVLAIIVGAIFITDKEKPAFFLGVAASVVATFLTKFIDKYFEGNKIALKIANLSQSFIRYYKDATKDGHFNCHEHKFNMIQIYNDMCHEAADIYYSASYRELSLAMDDVITAISSNADTDVISEKIEAVILARSKVL